MRRNESRNEAVYIVSISMALKSSINQHTAQPEKPKPFVIGRILRCPPRFLAPGILKPSPSCSVKH